MVRSHLRSNQVVRSQFEFEPWWLDLKSSSPERFLLLLLRPVLHPLSSPAHLERLRDLVLELRPAVEARRHGAPIPKLLKRQHLVLKATAQMDRPSHEDVCWLEVAMNAAIVVDEAQRLENAVQDVAHAALCEGVSSGIGARRSRISRTRAQ